MTRGIRTAPKRNEKGTGMKHDFVNAVGTDTNEDLIGLTDAVHREVETIQMPPGVDPLRHALQKPVIFIQDVRWFDLSHGERKASTSCRPDWLLKRNGWRISRD